MAKRNIKRNGRGQIVSYEIPSGSIDSYGNVLLSSTDSQEYLKYEIKSFRDNVDSEITEFINNPEYAEAPINVTINLPGFSTSGAINIPMTNQQAIDTNPNVQFGYILPFEGTQQNNDNSSGTFGALGGYGGS